LPALNSEQKNNDTEDYMDKALCAALGIAESADEKDALAAEKQLAELNAEAFKKEAEAAVDEAIKAGKFPPASRETCLALCADKTGLEKFKALAAASPSIVDGRAVAPETAPPPGGGGTALNSGEAAMAKAMGYSVEEYQKIKEAGK
jgi:phage I-like protein